MTISASRGVLRLQDSKAAIHSLRKRLQREASVIHGTAYDDGPSDAITVAVLATGIRAI